MIQIAPRNRNLNSAMAKILSTDRWLHQELAGSLPIMRVTGDGYDAGCRAWEARKHGTCYAITNDGVAIGSISFAPAGDGAASVGYWIRSDLWNRGYGTCALMQMKEILKAAGYRSMTASILKTNSASKKVWEKCGAVFTESGERCFPHVTL